jgi:ABC-type multidrug transport system fused ATPase/permease subunit
LTYAANYMQPFNEISDVITEIDYAWASFERIEKAIHAPKNVDQGKQVIGLHRYLEGHSLELLLRSLAVSSFRISISRSLKATESLWWAQPDAARRP